MPSFRALDNQHADPRYSTNRALEETQSQWLFTPSELTRTPSVLDGMPVGQEQANRSKGVNFITQVGILLKLPQLTLSTASVYLHRFFMRHSMVDLPNRPGLHHYSIAATALFLATKVEENCRKMRELVVACCRVAQKQPNLVVDDQSKEYWKWRDTILHNEDLLLEALCFDLQLEQPYRILYDFLCHYKVQENKHLRNTSWAFLNDSHLTTMSLLFTSRIVAGSAFYAGARFADLSFPDDENGQPWWEQLDLDIFRIQQACNLMAEVYENSTLPRQNQKEAYIKDTEISTFNRTRSSTTPMHAYSPARSAGGDSQRTKRDRDEFNRGDRPDQNGHNGSYYRRDASADHVGGPPTKRLRRESSGSNDLSRQDSSICVPLPVPQSRQTNGADVDDVQQRIDEIINASGPPPNTNSHPHPPLSRRPSTSQQQHWPGPPPRRRSSSTSNRNQPPSSHNAGHSGQLEHRPPSARYPSYDHPSRDDRDNDTRGFLPEDGQPVRPPSPLAVRPTFRQPMDVDDSEKVDYGSEEGEV